MEMLTKRLRIRLLPLRLRVAAPINAVRNYDNGNCERTLLSHLARWTRLLICELYYTVIINNNIISDPVTESKGEILPWSSILANHWLYLMFQENIR